MLRAANQASASQIANGLGYTPANQVGDTSFTYLTPTTGFNITLGNGSRTLLLEPAGVLATGTINLPPNPVNGQEARISSTQTITALTIAASNPQIINNNPTAFTASLTAAQGFAFIYRLATQTWYRLQ